METIEVLELIGIIVAVIFGISSLVVSLIANKKSKEANIIAKKSNEIADQSLQVSKRMEEASKENVKINNNTNVLILKNSDRIMYAKTKSYSDYILVIPIEITNLSTTPVTVKRPTFRWGKDGKYFFAADSDFVDITSYYGTEIKNVNQFPIYIKEKESVELNVAIGVEDSDRITFYTNHGITLYFEATQSNYQVYIEDIGVIEV